MHTPEHLSRLRAIDAPQHLDPDTVASETSWEAVCLAAGIALEAVDRGGFALIRPPGHHALSDRAMGFCLVNNVVIAARYAQAELGLDRVAILDWDVHHGNGTEAIVRDDHSILFVSLHQWPFYPGTGGPGTTSGNILNVPLPAGSGDAAYARRSRRSWSRRSPLSAPISFSSRRASMRTPTTPCPTWSERGRVPPSSPSERRTLAPRVAAVLEGGYNLATLPALVETRPGGLLASSRASS